MPESELLPLYEVVRCPDCSAFLFEGRLPKGTFIELECRRCKPKDGKRRRIVIER